jgi:N-acetylmuramic acid 6-phosphate (MurNAc-6-P) etherase
MRREGAFSVHDNILVTYVNGGTQLFEYTSGEIRLNRFKGEQQVHKLRNVNKLVVGIANKGSMPGYVL